MSIGGSGLRLCKSTFTSEGPFFSIPAYGRFSARWPKPFAALFWLQRGESHDVERYPTHHRYPTDAFLRRPTPIRISSRRRAGNMIGASFLPWTREYIRENKTGRAPARSGKSGHDTEGQGDWSYLSLPRGLSSYKAQRRDHNQVGAP